MQVSVSKSKDVKMTNLRPQHFLKSDNVYWVTARQREDVSWLALLGASSRPVREYQRRVSIDAYAPSDLRWVATHGDIMEKWLGEWSAGKAAAGTRPRQQGRCAAAYRLLGLSRLACGVDIACRLVVFS